MPSSLDTKIEDLTNLIFTERAELVHRQYLAYLHSHLHRALVEYWP
jgi:hypothetical protein